MTPVPADAALYQHAACGLLLTDSSGLILRANETLCRWLGVADSTLVGQQRIHAWLPIGARLFYQTHCLPLLALQGAVTQVQLELDDQAGQRLPVLVNIMRRDSAGSAYDEWAMFAITERRSYERELLVARRSAEQALAAQHAAQASLHALNQSLTDADRRKDEFLATLSHELRNPLAPMRNTIEVLKLGHGDGAIRPLLDVFDRQLQHMTHLVDDLMDVGRITQGRMALRRAPLLLADVLQHALHDNAPLLRQCAHTLSVSIDTPDAIVDADQQRLLQVLVNLLTNACKYTPHGGAITLRLWCEAQQACLSVADNGIGIAAPALNSVFDMFSQLTPALAHARGGLGIGLALVRGILALHGGSIEVASAGPGLGSSFTLRLPLAARSSMAATPTPTPAQSSMISPIGPASVLVVDDNVDAAESLLMFFTMSGCTAQAAHSAHAALCMLEQFTPTVALFDIDLPDLNGYELARRVRQRPGGAALLLIAATGWGQDSDKQRALDAGFDHHLTKPIDFAQLRALLAAPASASALASASAQQAQIDSATTAAK